MKMLFRATVLIAVLLAFLLGGCSEAPEEKKVESAKKEEPAKKEEVKKEEAPTPAPAPQTTTSEGDMKAAAQKWIDEEFQPSTLSKDEQMKEMEWFMTAAAPFKGMEIKVVSETIPTHEYESKVMAKAFYDITGIKVTHDLIQEGDVIDAIWS